MFFEKDHTISIQREDCVYIFLRTKRYSDNEVMILPLYVVHVKNDA